jgi:Lipase (class 3)
MSLKVSNLFLLYALSVSSTILFSQKKVLADGLTISSKDSAAFCDVAPGKCQAIYETTKISGAAYLSDKPNLDKPNDKRTITTELASQGWNSIQFVNVQNASVDAQAILAKKELDGKTYYLISFRGTQIENKQDRDTDLATDRVVFNKNRNDKVHEGFLNYTKAIMNDSKTKAFLVEALNNSNSEIISTGHSLGGASAQIFSAILQEKSVPQEKIQTIVFGSPPPGNQSFSDKYLSTVVKVKNANDPVTFSTTGGVSTINVITKGIIIGSIYNWDGYSDNYGTTVNIDSGTNLVDAHTAYGEKIQAILGGKIGDLNASNFNVYNSCITMASSSAIQSSSCFKQPSQNPSDAGYAPQVVEGLYAGALNEGLQQKSQVTNGTIVNAPLDIGLEWRYSNGLDLDSHLLTPKGDHIFFGNRGSLDAPVNAFLYRDSIPDTAIPLTSGAARIGAEQTRISTFSPGEYKFYVNNYSQYINTPNSQVLNNTLSTSDAKVSIFEGGAPLPSNPNDPTAFNLSDPLIQKQGQAYKDNLGNPVQIAVPSSPNQSGNTWYVFKLDTRTGILYKVNNLINITNPTIVPTGIR